MKRLVRATATVLLFSASQAVCGDATQKPPPAASWLDSLSVAGYFSGGEVINFARPFNKINFGHLETDRANWPQFNQAILNVARPLDKNANSLDFGLSFTGMLGTDARYTQFLGQTEYLIRDRTQLSIVQANLTTHLPILTEGGVDIQLGEFISYNGFEKLTAKDNIFYTRSLSANFGPFVDTGVMSIIHATDWLDLYAGLVTGVDTTIGWPGDINNSPSIHAGFGLNLLDGDLSILAVTHSGPEYANVKDPLLVGWPNGIIGGIPAGCACNPNNAWTSYNNLTTVWNATKNLSFVTDISYYRDSGSYPVSIFGSYFDAFNALPVGFGLNTSLVPQHPRGANAYGVAQYATYAVSDSVKLGARVEFWRDAKNFFAAAYPGYFDSVNSEHGFPAPSVIVQPQGHGTSYLAITAGVTFSQELTAIPYFSGLIIRPEFRWEAAVNDAAPFFGPNGPKRTQGLLSMDVIAPFTIK